MGNKLNNNSSKNILCFYDILYIFFLWYFVFGLKMQ